jgi:hypothetical protein
MEERNRRTDTSNARVLLVRKSIQVEADSAGYLWEMQSEQRADAEEEQSQSELRCHVSGVPRDMNRREPGVNKTVECETRRNGISIAEFGMILMPIWERRA